MTGGSRFGSTWIKDLFKHPPQRLLQVLVGQQAVAMLPVEFASTQKRVPDLVFLRLRRLETVVKKEAEEMALTFNVMENDVLRPLFLQERMDGKQEEGASMLTRLLQRRFGNVPTWASEKIAKAELPSLEEWSLRFVDAKTLDEVFADPA